MEDGLVHYRLLTSGFAANPQLIGVGLQGVNDELDVFTLIPCR
jgi:hypothetical protein